MRLLARTITQQEVVERTEVQQEGVYEGGSPMMFVPRSSMAYNISTMWLRWCVISPMIALAGSGGNRSSSASDTARESSRRSGDEDHQL
jgi:hypothetical protein